MALSGALLAVETGVQRTVSDQRDSVIGLASIQPCLQRGRDVDVDIIVDITAAQRHAGGNRCAKSRSEVRGDGFLRPGAIYEIDIEAACARYGIDVEFQRGLGDIAARVASGNLGE